MSDDGYYPGSPYEEFDDHSYDDDIGENLADDLAEHTLPSPIYHEDPAYEMLEYFSDWEYYSDDYYDDDPALLREDAQDSSKKNPLRKAKMGDSLARGKKRKLADTTTIPSLALNDRPALAATVRGTVWREPKPQSPEPYQVGRGQRIALLKNWAQIFERSSPRSMLKRDESWANDMSLEDMGLRKVESVSAQDASGPVQDEANERPEEEEMEENSLDQIDGGFYGVDDTIDGVIADEEVEDDQPTKRQRMVPPLPSPPASYNSSNTSTETIVENMKNTSMTSADDEHRGKPTRGKSRKKSYSNLKLEVEETSVKTKKRKASPDAELSDPVTSKSVASTRAKRVASSKLSTAKAEKPPPMLTTRATRSKMK